MRQLENRIYLHITGETTINQKYSVKIYTPGANMKSTGFEIITFIMCYVFWQFKTRANSLKKHLTITESRISTSHAKNHIIENTIYFYIHCATFILQMLKLISTPVLKLYKVAMLKFPVIVFEQVENAIQQTLCLLEIG